MELKNRTHGSKQFAEKTGLYRKIMPLKPLFSKTKEASYT